MTTLTLDQAAIELMRSPKFQAWGTRETRSGKPRPIEQSNLMKETHYTPAELAEMWGVSTETVRVLFREEPGVLKIGPDGTRFRRGYKTLRIPYSVAERVHTRLSA
jgi:hypothetical protein